MARAKKITVVEELNVEELPKEEKAVDVIDTSAPEETIVDDAAHETLTLVIPQRKTVKKIHLITGPVAISDLRMPIGFDAVWGEDKVIAQRIGSHARLEVIIPDECNLPKWVTYYRSLAKLGIGIVGFGTEEVK
jgi:hypothetical protein